MRRESLALAFVVGGEVGGMGVLIRGVGRTPLLNLRWYLINFQPGRRRALEAVNAAFLVVFPVCRIYLIYYVVRLYGSYYGESAVQTFRKRLMLPCQLGTGSLALMNTFWWLTAARRTARRLGRSFGTVKNG